MERGREDKKREGMGRKGRLRKGRERVGSVLPEMSLPPASLAGYEYVAGVNMRDIQLIVLYRAMCGMCLCITLVLIVPWEFYV